MPDLNVLSICGSLRKGSFNAMAQRALPALAPDGHDHQAGAFLRRFSALQRRHPELDRFPAPVNTLADAIRAADGVIFCTPEYNFTIPGGLKNALDWVSRLPEPAFGRQADRVAIGVARTGRRRTRAIRRAQGDGVPRRLRAQQAGNLYQQLRCPNSTRRPASSRTRPRAASSSSSWRPSRPSSRGSRRRAEAAGCVVELVEGAVHSAHLWGVNRG